MIAAARAWVSDLAAFALPQRCPGCGAGADPARLLCDACRGAIPRLSFPLCARCLVRGRDPGGCRAHPLHRVWAAWSYDERAARVVHALKYGERPTLARGLAVEIAKALPPRPRPELVIEVPLHPARLRERGYNQAARLAESLADAIGVPRIAGVLRRTRSTRAQARLGPEERRRNLAGAFAVEHAEWIDGREVLLVDDVITTGATFEACAEALIEAGARPVGAALAWAQ